MTSAPRPRPPNRWLRSAANLAIAVALLFAVSFLPPDTSLSDRQKTGVLKLCVPPAYPPLVTGEPARPGFDIELAGAVAERIGLRLQVNTLSSIGKDFNPRNWALTRGQCDIIAGGVADTVVTRSFLETIPTPVETGWVGVGRSAELPAPGAAVAVLAGTSGLDRLQLSGWLRRNGWRVVPARSARQFVEALASGQASIGVTERSAIAALALPADIELFPLPAAEFPQYRMAFGLWKGDQTLKRVIAAAIDELGRTGELAALEDRYGTKG